RLLQHLLLLFQMLFQLLAVLLRALHLLQDQLAALLHNPEKRTERIFVQQIIQDPERDDRVEERSPLEVQRRHSFQTVPPLLYKIWAWRLGAFRAQARTLPIRMRRRSGSPERRR